MIAANNVTPGIYRGMPDTEYRAIPAVSKSDLDAWAIGREIDPHVAEFGTAFHTAILEPDLIDATINALPPGGKRADAPQDGRIVLTNSDYKKLLGMVASVKEHPELSQLREMAHADRSRCELVLVWIDEETGLLCKAKADQVTDLWLYDWKTTGSDMDGFSKSVGAFFYHVQAAHYLSGAKACGLEVQGFRFACVCKRADKGHPCWLYEMDESWLLAGMRTLRVMLNLYARYGKE